MTAIAVDFGSSNTLIGQWNEVTRQPEILAVTAISTPQTALIPSLLYFRDIKAQRLAIGNQVVGSGYKTGESGYFDQIKRSLLIEDVSKNLVNDVEVNPQLVGKLFLQQVFKELSKQLQSQNLAPNITNLIFTAPVQAYERYLRWIESCSPDLMEAIDFDGDIRIIDEPTAAALGYGISQPNSLILVIDFGGGTLDICLVRTPKAKNLNDWGEVIGGGTHPDRIAFPKEIGNRYLINEGIKEADSEDLGSHQEQVKARQVEVIAKTGQALGGSDIDRWIWEHMSQNFLLSDSSAEILRSLMERMKVTLSSEDTATEIFYDPENLKAHSISYSRVQLEEMLKRRGVYRILQTAIDEVINRAVGKGILKMDIKDVVLVGGSTLIPSVQSLIRNVFPRATIHSDRPFEAVVYGALWLNQGLGIRDHLFHDYAIRFLSSSTKLSTSKIPIQSSPKSEESITPKWQYQPLFQRGQAYPTKHPCEIILRASQADQAHIDLVIGELEKRSSSSVEVIFQGDRLVSEVSNQVRTKFLPLTSPDYSPEINQTDFPQLIIPLNPLGQIGVDRLRVIFEISDRRQLIVTVIDLLTEITLFSQVAIADLH